MVLHGGELHLGVLASGAHATVQRVIMTSGAPGGDQPLQSGASFFSCHRHVPSVESGSYRHLSQNKKENRPGGSGQSPFGARGRLQPIYHRFSRALSSFLPSVL